MAQNPQYPNSIAIFKQDDTSNNKPQYTGTITLSNEILADLKKHDILELSVSMWVNESKKGTKYQGGSIDIPYKVKQGTAAKEPAPALEGDDAPW
jgi:hypothetical protein